MEFIKKKTDELKYANYNPRKKLKPEDKEYQKIKNSIQEFGYVEPIIINKDNTIIGGHQRLTVLKDLGYKEVDVIQIDIDKTKEKALNIALNKITGEWDYSMLGDLLLDLDSSNYDLEITGFDLDEIESIIAPLETEEKEVIEDDFDCTPPEEPKAKYGDIYQLGNHRLMCGDSTNNEDIKKLMGEQKADMIFTDPPYNVDYDGGSKKREKIKNDNIIDFYDFLLFTFKNCFDVLKDGGSIYICHNELERVNFTEAFLEVGFKFSSIIIWAKNNSTFSMGKDYKQKHEPIIYGWKEGEKYSWFGGSCEDTVWEIKRPSKSELHPTMKPIELCSRAIKNSSKSNQIIYDPFGGSGSTLIACEQLNRNCYMMELDPKYVDVIINRWETFTGKKAIKVEGDE